VALLRRVADLLYTQGYTIKGVQRLLREGGGALQENIPPASAEERQAAEAERAQVVAEAAAAKQEAAQQPIPQPVPSLAPAELEPEPFELAPVPVVQIVRDSAEADRLRGLLAETLGALEELRRLLG
jgi:hypothetical protein